MIFSNFNNILKSNNNSYILFNSLSGAIIELSRDDKNLLLEMKNNPNLLDNCENKDLFIEKKIFVKDDIKEIQKKTFIINKDRYHSDVLDLTIVPSLACDFKCIYCFQEDIDAQTMNKETEDNLIQFTKYMTKT